MPPQFIPYGVPIPMPILQQQHIVQQTTYGQPQVMQNNVPNLYNNQQHFN